ncbi:hypothetical protein BGZ80_006892 [Entomortierella chlamydospora]|uniref:Rad21/Rec8-like protein C-terminal eukaryotic domain-containing protein n=1 Tax=Entomortierella chlamydospora TaxID=101097 RepID=A0A9P6T1U2_9FUNG|nr:hypothetical protein BGZ79_007511 [Entomortierella chlamydospora]KAG0018673.1 hypothetical protein BGZ80_006892 [Entomortierella chlamydospora]
MGAFDERRRRITLDEGSILGVTRPSPDNGERFNFDIPDDALVGEDLGLYIDSEGNLVDYAPALGIEDSGDKMLVPQISGITGSLGKHTRDREHDEYPQAAQPNFFQAEDVYMHDGHEQGTDKNLQFAEAIPQRRPRIGERQPKPSRLIIDEHTMLPRENMLESRENFQLHQAALIRERESKQAALSAKARIEGFMTRPLCVSGYGPDLATFWGSASARTVVTPVAKHHVNTTAEADQFNDTPLFFGAERDVDMSTEPPEPEEVRRRHMSADVSTTPVDLGGDGFGLGDIGSSNHSSHMPWSIDMRASVSVRSEHSSAGSDRHRRDFEAAFDKALGRPTQGRRTPSDANQGPMELDGLDDEPLIRRRHHTQRGNSASRSRESSRGASRQRTSSAGEGELSSSMGAYDPILDLVGQQDDGVMNPSASNASEKHAVIERETINFMGYVRSILTEAKTNIFSFEDVISVHGRRDVAASAFYHILSLSTMGKMRPTQAEPYKDIYVELIE